MAKQGLSVVIPVFNEKGGLRQSIDGLHDLLVRQDFKSEIILVNDGSTDGTSALMEKIVEEIPGIELVTHEVNRGYGAALKSGIRASQYDYIAITDADGTYPNKRIPEFFHVMVNESVDMVVGARRGENVNIPLIRRPAKWAINRLAEYLSGRTIPDLNSGLRIFRKSLAQRFMRLFPDGFSFTTTITLCALTNGYSVKYLNIEYGKRSGQSKIRPIYDTVNFVQLIIRTVMYFNPLKIFVPASLATFALGFCLILYRLLVAPQFGVTSVVVMMGGVQMLAIGMLADLINKKTPDIGE